MGIQNCGFSYLWVLKFVGTKNLWTSKRCGYSKFVGTIPLFCRYSKFVGSKIEGFQICGYLNFVVIINNVK